MLSNAYIPPPHPLSPALSRSPTSYNMNKKGMSGRERCGYGVMGMSICM